MKRQLPWKECIITIGLLTAVLALSLLLQRIDTAKTLMSMLFVLAVFLISMWTQGYLWGILSSLAIVLIDNYVFAFPVFAFDFLLAENFISAVVLLAVSILTSTLTTKLKRQERIKAETETEKMRANLLRAVSHDLRTPLTTIYGASSAIIDSYDSIPREQQLKLLQQVQDDSENLIRMVENLLSVTRANSEGIRVSKIPTVLEELIDATLLKFSKAYPQQAVTVSIPDEFVSIPMDAMLIRQVLINLLENAVFHAHGMTELKLQVELQGNDAVFSVIDNGCGIPRDRLPDLFTGQLYGTTTPSDSARTGMGIGLSVCAAIIQAHSSEIFAENRPEGGACFRFRLEMEEQDHEQ